MLLLYISHALPTQPDMSSLIQHHCCFALTTEPPMGRHFSRTTPSAINGALPTYLSLAAVFDVKHYSMHTAGDWRQA